jgi:hypothetical protein
MVKPIRPAHHVRRVWQAYVLTDVQVKRDPLNSENDSVVQLPGESFRLWLVPGLVRLDAFYLNAQQHVLLKAILLAVIHAKVRATERAGGIRAANLLLDHWVFETFEGIDGERDGLRHAMQRQIARDGFRRAIRKLDKFAIVRLLIIMLLINAVSAMIFVPAWVDVFKPGFILRRSRSERIDASMGAEAAESGHR